MNTSQQTETPQTKVVVEESFLEEYFSQENGNDYYVEINR